MSMSAGRIGVAAVACLVWLGGCETSTKLGDLFQSKNGADPQTTASIPDSNATGEPETTAGVGSPTEGAPQAAAHGLLGSDPNDDLSLGKKYYRTGNFGIAERHFRRAVELHPRDGEAWVGLAASYDKLRRFDLADRAYAQAIGIVGQTAEILNNKGYSYMLRGDYKRAREALLAAQAKDPDSPYVRNNLEMLDQSYRKGKAVQ
jgi:tetratricopeptide (TPR) repeat protein